MTDGMAEATHSAATIIGTMIVEMGIAEMGIVGTEGAANCSS
jgi:hypothetical protein